MSSRNKVEGRICSFRSRQECADLGISFPNIPSIVTCHMVLVLDWVPEVHGFVEVMTVKHSSWISGSIMLTALHQVTSKLRSDGEYLPISPTKKKPFPIQLRLQNGPESIHWNMRILNPTVLRLFSYLKIDSHYEVPLHILKEEVDRFGCQLMLCFRHQGGIRHLRSYLMPRKRSQERPRSINELGYGV